MPAIVTIPQTEFEIIGGELWGSTPQKLGPLKDCVPPSLIREKAIAMRLIACDFVRIEGVYYAGKNKQGILFFRRLISSAPALTPRTKPLQVLGKRFPVPTDQPSIK